MDIAIVGAGVAGSYAAWKLSEKYPDKSIHLYETNNRVGGKIYSVPVPGITDFVAEMGAMRFQKVEHPITWRAIQDLGLEVVNFPNPTTGTTHVCVSIYL